METFKIEIQEFLSRIIEVEAETKDEAIIKVRQLYRNEEIVLDSNDYVSTEIEVYENEWPKNYFKRPKDANLIALDAGSSQTYDDIEYLEGIGLSETLFKITLKLVSDFYSEKLLLDY